MTVAKGQVIFRCDMWFMLSVIYTTRLAVYLSLSLVAYLHVSHAGEAGIILLASPCKRKCMSVVSLSVCTNSKNY